VVYDPRKRMSEAGGSKNPLGTLGAGLKGAAGGALTGATYGMMFGLPGAAVGAAVGASAGALIKVTKKLYSEWDKLAKVSKELVGYYGQFNGSLRAIDRSWKQLDKRMNTLWARTLEPQLRRWSKFGMEFQENWTKIKVDLYKATAPLTRILTSMLTALEPMTRMMAQGLTRTLSFFTRVIPKYAQQIDKKLIKPIEDAGKAAGVGPVTEGIMGPFKWVNDFFKLLGDAADDTEGPPKSTLRPDFDISAVVPKASVGESQLAQPVVAVNVNVTDTNRLVEHFETAWQTVQQVVQEREAAMEMQILRTQVAGAYA